MTIREDRNVSGVGLGLRPAHIKPLLEQESRVSWFELLSDNWFGASGLDGVLLDEVKQRYPLALHSVALNVGGVDPINRDYLTAIKELSIRTGSDHISDHLCFSAVDGKPLHDLAPIPYTQDTLNHVCNRLDFIQEFLGHTISLENITAYIHCLDSTMSEAGFLNELAKRTGCSILLDVNNLYVNEQNLGRSAKSYIKELNPSYVSQYHLGGFHNKTDFLLDAHDQEISQPVLELYRYAIERIGIKPTLIEWDHNLPELSLLLSEYNKVRRIYNSYSLNLSVDTEALYA